MTPVSTRPGCFVRLSPWRSTCQLYADIRSTSVFGVSKSGGFTSVAKLWLIVSSMTVSFEEFWLVLSEGGDLGWTSTAGWDVVASPDNPDDNVAG